MKFLLIRFSSIGDMVLTSPVIRCLKMQLPQAEIHFLTKEAYAPIVFSNPYLNKVYSFNKDIQEVIPELKGEQYDYVIDLQHNIRSAQVKWALWGVPSKTFKKWNIRKWLLVQFKWDTLPKVHIVDRYMATVSSLGVVNDNKGLDFFIPPAQEVPLGSLPISYQQGYVVIVVGSNHITKQLTNDMIITLINQCAWPVVLLGGKSDKSKAKDIEQASRKGVFNACGHYSIHESASIIQQAKAVITPDTGLMHIASAFDVPIVSVWGNTVPSFGMYPYKPLNPSAFLVVEKKGLSCRPCSKLGYEACPKKHFKCITTLEVKNILAALPAFPAS